MPSQRSARVTPSEHDESIAANEPLGDNIVYEPLSRPVSADDAGARQHAGVAPLRKGQLIAYALPAFSTTSLSLLISLYVNDFYGARCRRPCCLLPLHLGLSASCHQHMCASAQLARQLARAYARACSNASLLPAL